MKPLLFQLVYQAASTVLLLFYVNKYQLGKGLLPGTEAAYYEQRFIKGR